MSLSPSSSPSSSSSDAATAVTAIATAIPLSTALATIAAPSPITALPAPNANPNANLGARRGLPPPCWTNDETLALIDSYKEKWYSLNRSNLRAAHWDEVAVAVADRSLQIPAATPKTSVQCRHKIEKLRKRYRSERQRSLAHNPHAPPSSPWIFFSKMDQMENPNPNPTTNWYQDVPNGSGEGGGGMKFKIPKAARTLVGNPNPKWYEGYDDEDEIEYRRSGGNGGGLKIPKAARSSAGNPNFGSNYNPNPSYSVKPGLKEMRRRLEAKRRREEEEEEDDNNDVDERDSSSTGEMARVLRMFADGYTRMEQRKMEMAREMERVRMEMELKRTEMILDTQKRIVDAFVKGIVGEKKVKRSSNS